MKKYIFLEHTADVRLKIQASTLEELFQAALEGMNSLMKKKINHETEKTVKEKFSLSAADESALLVDFLSEILTISQIDKTVFTTAIFEKLTEQELEASIHGVPVYSFDNDIKAVTYHEAYVKKNEKDEYEALIIFDI
ncbi:MAG: archease [bacterium]